jgi:hypothetical protein
MREAANWGCFPLLGPAHLTATAAADQADVPALATVENGHCRGRSATMLACMQVERRLQSAADVRSVTHTNHPLLGRRPLSTKVHLLKLVKIDQN